MPTVRIALANLEFPSTPADAVAMAVDAVGEAGRQRADVICFPECFIPGYRMMHRQVAPVDQPFLEHAWQTVAAAARHAQVTTLLGTERYVDDTLRISVLVIDADGTYAGFQDKIQYDPSEEGPYSPGSERRVFRAGPLTFGIAICHEGFRYPETVRWAARHGAQVVFHPHYHEGRQGDYQPTVFADPVNSFHEKAVLCRAAENTCFVASVNCAGQPAQTTSVVARPDGTVQAYQPYGKAGLLIADLNLSEATLLLASRLRMYS
jgi:predicted amidohydrolase